MFIPCIVNVLCVLFFDVLVEMITVFVSVVVGRTVLWLR